MTHTDTDKTSQLLNNYDKTNNANMALLSLFTHLLSNCNVHYLGRVFIKKSRYFFRYIQVSSQVRLLLSGQPTSNLSANKFH